MGIDEGGARGASTLGGAKGLGVMRRICLGQQQGGRLMDLNCGHGSELKATCRSAAALRVVHGDEAWRHEYSMM